MGPVNFHAVKTRIVRQVEKAIFVQMPEAFAGATRVPSPNDLIASGFCVGYHVVHD